MQLSATEKSKRFAQIEHFDIHSLRGLGPLMVLLAVTLSGCGDKPPAQAAAAPLPVTVAQPTKRTVTDWDEFTGRFEAIEEVQVRARVGGFVNSGEFRDGAIVRAGDLLYTIDSRPFEAVALQADDRPRQPPSRQPRQSRAGQRGQRHAAHLDRHARPDLHLFRRR